MFVLAAVFVFAVLTEAVPYPGIVYAGSSSCDKPGALLCKGPNQFGICNVDNTIVYQDVAAGMSCSCDAKDDCSIDAAGSDRDDARPAHKSSHAGHKKPAHKKPTHEKPAHKKPAHNKHAPKKPTHERPPQKKPAHKKPTGYNPPATGNHYTQYTGDGSIQDGWPSMDEWLTFEQLWTGYEPIIGKNCGDLPTPVRNNNDKETAQLRKAVLSQSQKGGVPAAFALAILMQESQGCVAVATTTWSHANPGIYQSFQGESCFGKDSCSAEEIEKMAQDGIRGSAQGPGLEQDSKSQEVAGSEPAQIWYEVARIYNAGSLINGDGGAPGATRCYAMDVANRLTGAFFTGNTGCTLA